MEETRNTFAIILKRQSYRENDSLIVVYTKDYGKVSLIARGTKRPKSKLIGHLEPISLTEMMIVEGKGHDYVGGVICRDAFLGIKGDLNKIYYAGQALQMFNRLTGEGPRDSNLFHLLKKWLELVDDSDELTKERGELFLSFFIIRLLNELGYNPEMNNCVSCGKKITPGNNYFDLQNGGVVDKECFKANINLVSLSDNAIKLSKFILDNKFIQSSKVRVDKKTVKELSSLLNKFASYCS